MKRVESWPRPCLWCRNFHHPKMLSCALLSGIPVSLPDSWQPLICLMSVYSSFLDFHINGVMKHVVIPVWLPSLSPGLLRYIHVVSWNTTSFFFFFLLNSKLYMNSLQCVCLFNNWWNSGMCSVFGDNMNKAAITIWVHIFVRIHVFPHLLGAVSWRPPCVPR